MTKESFTIDLLLNAGNDLDLFTQRGEPKTRS